mmetsp:Transcript_21749/g.27707  ORF Transcript_21749/g.27707 Transcript_21749/m.27707 type:complete len:198 (+) Transcript_21749:26-619(+)
MHTNEQVKATKPKAWEFVSVFPENEKGTYGRRIAESKWQSQQPQSEPHPPRETFSDTRKRPSSYTAPSRATYSPPTQERHTVSSDTPARNSNRVRCQRPMPVQQYYPHIQMLTSPPQMRRRNLYDAMKVEDDEQPTFYQSARPQCYFSPDSSMLSSSVVGAKISSENISQTCPLTTSDPAMQQIINEEQRRKKPRLF